MDRAAGKVPPSAIQSLHVGCSRRAAALLSGGAAEGPRAQRSTTMTAPVDPNDVVMTGENSFMRLSPDGGKTMSDRLSHWRVLWCPAGTGHALFMQSTLIDGQVRIYGDNPAVARWLQRTLETFIYPVFADETIPVIGAEFARAGDPRSAAVETVNSPSGRIRLTWYECIEPFVV